MAFSDTSRRHCKHYHACDNSFGQSLMKSARSAKAAQVIDECAPAEMPDESWDRLATCHEWFARWTQRVIPHAVWQQAMHIAEKILVPDA